MLLTGSIDTSLRLYTTDPNLDLSSSSTRPGTPAAAPSFRSSLRKEVPLQVTDEAPQPVPVTVPEVVTETQPPIQEISTIRPTSVVNLLKQAGFHDSITTIFLNNKISGDILLNLTDQQLKDDLGIIAFGDRTHLSKFIAHLKESSAQKQTLPVVNCVRTNWAMKSVQVHTKFSVNDNETVKPQEESLVGVATTRSCIAELMVNESVLTKYVPLLFAITQNCELIYETTVLKREQAQLLVTTSNACTLKFYR